MVAKYYVAVKPQTNEAHAIHKEGCPFLPDDEKKIYLGKFESGKDAVKEGRRYFSTTKGCLFCSKEHEPHDERYVLRTMEDSSTIQVRCWQAGMVCCLN